MLFAGGGRAPGRRPFPSRPPPWPPGTAGGAPRPSSPQTGLWLTREHLCPQGWPSLLPALRAFTCHSGSCALPVTSYHRWSHVCRWRLGPQPPGGWDAHVTLLWLDSGKVSAPACPVVGPENVRGQATDETEKQRESLTCHPIPVPPGNVLEPMGPLTLQWPFLPGTPASSPGTDHADHVKPAQGLCTCCALCLESSYPKVQRMSLSPTLSSAGTPLPLLTSTSPPFCLHTHAGCDCPLYPGRRGCAQHGHMVAAAEWTDAPSCRQGLL